MGDEFRSEQEVLKAIEDRAPHLSGQSQRHACSFVMRRFSSPFQNRDIERGIEFGERQEQTSRASARRPGKRETLVPDLSAHSAKRRRWPSWVSPSVESLRQDLFGAGKPPFDEDQLLEAADWIEARGCEQHQRLKPLRELSGLRHRRNQERLSLSYYGVSQGDEGGLGPSIEVRTIRVHTEPAQGESPSALAALASFTDILSRVCGLRQEEAVQFVLCGVEPELQPLVLLADPQIAALPSGKHVTEPQVLIRVFAPPTDREIRKIRGYIHQLWEECEREWNPEEDSASPPLPEELGEDLDKWVDTAPQGRRDGSPRPIRITRSDERLQKILTDLSNATGSQGQGPPDFSTVWEEWKRRGFPMKTNRGDVTPQALRRRYYRLRKKDSMETISSVRRVWTEYRSTSELLEDDSVDEG